MKFESLEKCGGKWFSSLDRSAIMGSLDKRGEIFNPEAPQITEGVTVALSRPHREQKSGFFLFLPPVRLVGVVTYWQGDVLMFVRLRRLLLAGERRLASFFCNHQQSQLTEVPYEV